MHDDIITNIGIEDYINALVPPRPEVLANLEQRGKQHGLSLVGPVQGQLLYLLTRIHNARKVLEVGITTGYAAMWMSLALKETGGKLTAIEGQADRCKLATEVFEQAGMLDSFDIHQGNWAEIIPTFHEEYDMIFLDILRSVHHVEDAAHALDLCVPLLRPGGVLVTDNVLCNAQVLEDDPPPTVAGIKRFNEALMHHPELTSVILPLRDGVAISRKRGA